MNDNETRESQATRHVPAWWEIIERIRAEHNGVFSIEIFMGHDGHNACRFRDYDKEVSKGESGVCMQEAVERAYFYWKIRTQRSVTA